MSAQWGFLSDRDLVALYLTAAAKNVQWVLGSNRVENDHLVIEGWAIAMAGRPEDAQFLLNGIPFQEMHYPLPSPDIGEIYWNIPAAQTARFACKTTVDWERTWRDGFACLEFQDGSDREQVRRRAWYLPNPKDDLPIPSGPQIRRVIGAPDQANYLIGGTAIYKRVEHYLQKEFSRTFDDFDQILDWACGCGRVARNFRWTKRARLTGVDIDGDNVAWCRSHLPHAEFRQIPILPPLPFPDESFDLVLAISVLSQLSKEYQFAWLGELKRVARKGALVLAAVPGLTQIGLARPHPALMRELEEKGFLVTGRNNDLDDVMPEQTHYNSGIHSRAYLHMNFRRHFRIVEIVDAIAANDDLIVMKNDL